MNWNVMYELRDRLETAAIAGVGLLSEDFRLKRAVEQAAPLAAASPVFQKIIGQVRQLTASDCPDRSGLLLDVLALLDAVLCTQGSLQNGGTVEPLGDVWDGAASDGVASEGVESLGEAFSMRELPYSLLAPVREAFCGTGGGRYAVIRDAHEANPEIFDDYRVVYWMVQALGDSYGDLAEMTAGWLEEKGSSVVPLLKSGFRRDGKRDMERRLKVMDAAVGAGENAFYRSVLEQKGKISKGVREAAVFALRHSEENVPFLLELIQKEKGSVKQEAQRALALLDGAAVEDYWKTYMEEKPEEAAAYLTEARTDWAADLIAGELTRQIELRRERMEHALKKFGRLRDEDREALQMVWDAAEGKYSPKLGACYEQAYHFLGEEVPLQLIANMVRNPAPELYRQVEKLFQKDPEGFLEAYAVEVLLTRDGKTAYELLERQMHPQGILEKLSGQQNLFGWQKQSGQQNLFGQQNLSGQQQKSGQQQPSGQQKLAGKQKLPGGLTKALVRVRYVKQDGSFRLLAYRGFPIEDNRLERRLPEPLDLRWYPLLLENPKRLEDCRNEHWTESYDEMVVRLYRPDVPELQPLYGRYFYNTAVKRVPSVLAVRMMKRCGWKDYKGILTRALELQRKMGFYEVMQVLRELPLSSQELADEIDAWLPRNGNQRELKVYADWRDALRSGTAPQDLGIFGRREL